MASVTLQPIVWWAEISPNTTSGYWHWTNPPSPSVCTFSAIPLGGEDTPTNEFYGLEPVNVSNWRIAGFENKTRARCKVKNTFPFKQTYQVFISIGSS